MRYINLRLTYLLKGVSARSVNGTDTSQIDSQTDRLDVTFKLPLKGEGALIMSVVSVSL